MAIRGTQAKLDITKKILETFPGSFVYEKEIRIPYTEDGIDGQIKVVLTAAKTPVENENAAVIPANSSEVVDVGMNPPVTGEKIPEEPSKEEKERLTALINKLGL